MTDNLDLWNRVEKTDPAHTKKANIGGFGITAIAPQYQILNATREFGPYGKTWGFKAIDLHYNLIASELSLMVFKGEFFFPDGGFEIISSIKLFKDNAKTKVDDDFAKKLETDALTKALSKLGFNADVFMGRFDDNRYVEQMAEEFSADHTEYVTSEQVKHLSDALNATGYSEADFLIIASADSLDKIAATRYAAAMQHIQKRAEPQEAAE